MGGGGGKGGSSSTSVSIPPEVIARYNAVNAQAQSVAQTPFTPYSSDPNAFVAPLNATQNAGVAGTNQYANAAQPYYQTAADYTTQGAASANPTALDQNSINQYMSPYLNDVVGSTVANLRQQQQQEQSGLLGNAAMAGAFGGDRAGIAQANLAKQQDLASGQTISNLLNQGYGQALQTAQQQQGLDLASQQANLARLSSAGQQMAALGTGAQGAGLAGAQAQLAAGQVGQQTAQAGQSALYNQFLQQQGYPFQVTQFLANIAEGTGALSGSTTNTVQASDRRLKHDIKEIGTTHDGEPLYAFKYHGSDVTHYGPMAQNVEQRHPEDVGLAGGYKTVDYDAVADRAAAAGLAGGQEEHAAHGGAMNSEGGVVLPFRAREGFAGAGVVNSGVAAGFDPYYIQSLLAQRENQYSGLYGQPGSPYGSKGSPGGAGVVPKPMDVAKPLSPASPPPRQQGMNPAQIGEDVAKLYGFQKEVRKDYSDYQAKKAAADKAAADKAAADKSGGDQKVGEASPSDTPTKSPEAQPASDSPIVQKASYVADQQQNQEQGPDDPHPQLGGDADFIQKADVDSSEAIGSGSDLFETDLARGGRAGYATTGFVDPYDTGENPENIMKDVDQEGDKTGQDESEFNSMKSKSSGVGGGGESGLGEAASILGSVAKIGSFFLANGGVAGRQHHALGNKAIASDGGFGSLADNPEADPAYAGIVDDTDQDKGLGRLQIAQAATPSVNDGGVSPPVPPSDVPSASERAAPEPEKEKTPTPTPTPSPAPARTKPRLAKDETDAPFLAAANKMAPDLPGFLKSENLIVPALATLAAGLSSRAPTRTQGLGEALQAGVGAYTGMRTQNAQIGESEARTEKTFADIVHDNTYEVNGRMYFRYLKPDGTWGSMSQVDYLGLPPDARKNIQFDPRISDSMPQILENHQGTSAGAGTGAGAAGTGQPARGVQTAPRPIEGMTAIAPDQNDLAQSRRDQQAIVAGGRDRAAQEPDFYTPQKELADAAQNVRPVLGQLAGSLSSLPADKSILASGKAQEVLNPIAQYMDGLLRVMGLPTGINPEDLANTQATMKAVAQFQDRAASDAGRRAYASFAALANTLPSQLNTPRAQGKLLSSIYQANQIELDKQQYFDQVRQYADQYDPQTALKTGRSANTAFNNKYNAEFYAKEKKNVENMFGTVIQGMKDPRTGRDMTVMQTLTTNPGMLSKEDKQDIVKHFGGDPKILRYFGVSYP